MTEQVQEQENQQLDRKDVKILAYRQRVSEQEEKIADLTVECTFLNSQLQDALARLAEYEQPAEVPEEDEDDSSEED